MFWGNDYFAIINLALFGFTTGFGCCMHMNLAPQQCQTEKEKEIASFIMIFPLVNGILIGSLLAITLTSIQ